MYMPIEINAIETRRFGITAAKVMDLTASTDAVNAAAMAQQVQMLTVRVPTDDLVRVQTLEADGYRLMDTLVYYDCNLADLDPVDDPMIRLATPADADGVAEVARLSFAGYIGHYHTDPRLSDTNADAAYVEWAHNSIKDCGSNSPAYVALDADRITGFLTVRHNCYIEAEVVLNGIHPEMQSKGIYARLLAHALGSMKYAGFERALISTQVNNIPVQKVWSRLGLRMARSYYTFHKWF